MKLQQSLWVHGFALVLASGLAWRTWTDEETSLTLTRDRVQVWPANVEQLESVRFESDKRTVEVLVHKDEHGRWYEVRVDRELPGNAAHGHAHGAGGAAPQAPAPERKEQTFVSVTEAEKLAESLAPLLALRAVGRVEGDREKEFGFDEDVGTVVVRVAGKQHTLALGGLTPGGTDRYARVQETGEVFAVPGDLVRRFEQAESRLFERQLQNFGDQQPNRVRISYGERSRELVAVEGKLGGWAAPDTPAEQDETASNWMGKLGRLRVSSYLEEPKVVEGKSPVLTAEYFRDKELLGKVELFENPAAENPAARGSSAQGSSAQGSSAQGSSAQGPAEQPAAASSSGSSQPKYVARSQHVRWPAEVGSGAAEVVQDLGSLFE